jgi:hypothetical protein
MPERPRKNQIANVLWARYVLCCVNSLEKIKRIFVLCLVVLAISACTQNLNEMHVDVEKSKVVNRGIEDRNKFYERQRMLHHTTGNKEFFKLAVGLLF